MPASIDFDTARSLFDAALKASLESNMGTMRGEIARDALALMVEFPPVGFSLGNCERYMRHMLANGAIELSPETIMNAPALEDVAVDVSDYFWEELYFVYPGETKAKRLAEPESKRMFEESLRLIHLGDWDGLRTWFKENGLHFCDKRLKEVRGHSALMAWMKTLYEFERVQGLLAAMAPRHLQSGLEKVAGTLKNWRIAICMMIDAWPKLAHLPDFKMQTPLMLAADDSDLPLVQKLLAVAGGIGQQDFNGRTALHAAIAARSLPCVQALLAHAPEMTVLCDKWGQSPFHTAVRVGHVEIMAALIGHAAQWAHTVNDDGLTALELAEVILNDPQEMGELKRAMEKEGRKTGSVQDF